MKRVLLLLVLSFPALGDTYDPGLLRAEEPLGSLDAGPASGWQSHPHVASDGDGYLVVWNDARNPNHTFASRVDGNGRALEPYGIDLGPGVDADVVWTGTGLTGQLVARDHTPASPRLELLGLGNFTSSPEQASYGGGTLLTYSATNEGLVTKEKVIARLDGAGNLAESDRFPISVAFGNPFPAPAAYNGRSFLVTWYDMEDVYAAVLDMPSSRRRDPHVLATSAHTQSGPWLASDGGSEVLAMWVEDWRPELRGEIVRRDGTRIPIDSIVPPGTDFTRFSVAFDGTDYAVVWSMAREILMVRIGYDGAVLDRQPIVIATTRDSYYFSNPFAITGGGGRLLAVWSETEEDGQQQIAGSIVAGGEPGPRFVISPPERLMKGSMAAAWDGSQFFVAWLQQPFNFSLISPQPPLPIELRGARVAADGVVLEPGGMEIAPRRLYRGAPSVASNGRETLIVWTEGEGVGGTERTAWAARFGRNGSLTTIGPFAALGQSPYYPDLPRVIYDGSSYVVFRVAGAPAVTREGQYVLQRYSAEMQPLGEPVAVGTSGLGLRIGFDVVPLRTGEVAVGYERMASEPLFGLVPRVFVRMPVTRDGRSRAIRR